MASKQEIEAGRAFVRLFLKNDMSSQLARALQSAGAELKSFGVGAMTMGAKVAAAGAAMLGPLTAAVKSFASQGDMLDKMSLRTGVAASSLAELGFAAEQSGASLGDVEGAILKMNRRLGRITVGQGSGSEIAAMEELGLSIEKLNNMNPEERFLALADAMAAYGDQAAAAGLAQRAFGTGVDRIIPLLTQGREGIAALRAEARDLGIIPTEQEVKSAAKVTDALNRVRRVVKSMVFDIGASLAEPAMRFLESAKRIGMVIKRWIKDNGALIRTVAKIGGALLVAGGIVTAFGAAIWGIGSILGALGTAVTVLTSPIAILVAAVAGAGLAWVKFSKTGQQAWASLKAVVMPIIETLKTAFGGIKDALAAGDWALAGKIAMAGLKLAFLQGLSAIQKAFPETFNTILRVFGKIGDGIVAVWGKVTEFLTDQWNAWGKKTLNTVMGVARMIPQIWQKAVEGMANWMLATSAKGGIMGKAMSKILGVDMSEEQAKAEITEREGRKTRLSLFEDTAKVLEQRIAAGKDEDTGEQLSEREITVDLKVLGDKAQVLEQRIATGRHEDTGEQLPERELAAAPKALEDTRSKIADLQDLEGNIRALEKVRAQIADLRAGGSGTADSGIVDVLADAREAVKEYTERLVADAEAIGGTPGTGVVSDTLDAFLTKLESGTGISDAAEELAALQKEAAKRKAEAEPEPEPEPEPTPDGEPAPVGAPAVLAAPSGVALTATYSAAAARISGFQPGVVEPEREMATGIVAIDKKAEKMLTKTDGVIEKVGGLIGVVERFLAGWGIS